MIYVCKEFALNNDSSVAKFLKYLDKTNQDLVITPRRPEEPSKAGTAQTHVRQVNGTVANVMANGTGIIPPPRKQVTNEREELKGKSILVELPSGQLVTDWSRDLTIQIKRLLVGHGLSIQSLVRDGDLGLRSPKETVPLGVILKVTYSLSTRVADRSMKCYALPYTRYEAIAHMGLLADYSSGVIFILQNGTIHMLTK